MTPTSHVAAIRVGVVGLGFMGRTHVACVRDAAAAGLPCRLTAVADEDPQRRTAWGDPVGNIRTGGAASPLDLTDVAVHESTQRLLESPDVDLVSICTPTPTHVEVALAALAAGKHILVEKPLALRSLDVQRVAAAAGASGRVCMPAMCVRFWPGWSWLKELIASQPLGPVRSASFQRLAAVPGWSPFYRDRHRSGGPMFDLHIHDADFIRWCFGDPQMVATRGGDDHFVTRYDYAAGPALVTAESGWMPDGLPFRMRYLAAFERATVEYDSLRDPPLLVAGAGAQTPPLEPLTGYDLEIRDLVTALAHGCVPERVTLDDALRVTRLLEAEVESLRAGGAAVPITL